MSEQNFENELSIIKKKNFLKILNNSFEKPLDKDATHTSIGNGEYGGKWFVADENLKHFYSKIGDAMFDDNMELNIVERHKEVSPILIDLDIRYTDDVQNRQFDFNFIKKFIGYYIKLIKESYKNLPNLCEEWDELLDFHVLLKDDIVKTGDKIKDGIHIVMPNFITNPNIQYWFRNELISQKQPYRNELSEMFKNIKNKNPLSEVIDESVIYSNGWQLYGCCKPNNIPYKLKHIYGIKKVDKIEEDDLVFDEEKKLVFREKKFKDEIKNKKKLIKKYSIRYNKKFKNDENNEEIYKKLILNDENLKMINDLKSKEEYIKVKMQKITNTQKKSKPNHISKHKIYNKPGDDNHLNYIKSLVKILSATRADNYQDWWSVGVCLHNIDDRLKEDWIEFSKKSLKYKDGECETMWEYLPSGNKDRELLFPSLIRWVKQDSYQDYMNLYNKLNKDVGEGDLTKKLVASLSLTESDIADVIYKYYNGLGLDEELKFICLNLGKGMFAQYRQDLHRWEEEDETNAGAFLRTTFSGEILDLYNVKFRASVSEKITKATLEKNDEEVERLEERKKKIEKMVHTLKLTAKKNTLLKECNHKFLMKNAVNYFDQQEELIGFTNGVYDLRENKFRKGYPSDWITKSTNIEYNDFTYDSPEIIQLQSIINKILPIEDVREYFLAILSSCLSGKKWQEKFYVLTGSGANGKSVLNNLIKNAFGKYFQSMNVAALCSKRGDAAAANPELANIKGKRIITFSEPAKDEIVNTGKLKEWTGGDAIATRELYKGPIEFTPQATFFLLCNDIPAFPSEDDGTWRRVRIIDFPSKFKDEHEFTNKKYEFLRDYDVDAKLLQLTDAFMWLLIQKYAKFKESMSCGGIKEPDEVIASTSKQRKKNNPIQQYVDSRIEVVNDKKQGITITQMKNDLLSYFRSDGYQDKNIPKREEIKEKFNIIYPLIIKSALNLDIEPDGSKTKWTRIKFKAKEEENSNSDQDNNNSIINKIKNKKYNSDSDSDSD